MDHLKKKAIATFFLFRAANSESFIWRITNLGSVAIAWNF